MEILEMFYKEIADFFGFKGLFEILRSGDSSKLLTQQGMFMPPGWHHSGDHKTADVVWIGTFTTK
jgi:hypothetical protein